MNIWGKKKGGRKTKKREREEKKEEAENYFIERFAFIHWCFFDLTCFPRLLIICLFHQSSQIYAHAERQVLEGIF